MNNFLKSVKFSKVNLITAIFFCAFLTVLTIIFEPQMTLKGVLVLGVLIIGTGVCIAFPRLNLTKTIQAVSSFVLILAYSIVVPKRMFERTEVPLENDMTAMFDGAVFLNLIMIGILFFALLFITQRTSIAFGTTGIILLIFTLISYYAHAYRGGSLSICDFKQAATVATVMGQYDYTPSPELWKSILYFIFFIALGFRIDLPFKGVKYHIAISSIAIVGFTSLLLTYNYSHYWKDSSGLDGNGTLYGGEGPFGAYLYFIMSGKANEMPEPSDYSEEKVKAIADKASAIYEEHIDEIRPNIIFIMNEAFSDVSFLCDLETTTDYMPYWRELANETISGYTYANIQGGMTCDSEYEALTGDSMALLDVSAVPYEMQIDHDMPSLATVLKNQGYATVAMHPNNETSWNRNNVYKYLGFDRFVSIADFPDVAPTVGVYTSDEVDYGMIISEYEARDTNKPWFMFNVTIQNHSPYWEQTPITVETLKLGNHAVTEEDNMQELNDYLSMIKISDAAFNNLIEYFSNVSEPTMIVLFGDHQPKFAKKEFYEWAFGDRDLSEEEMKMLQYATPYLVWANYDIEKRNYGTISNNYLPAIICETAGVELPAYYKFLLNMRDEIPYMNRYNIGEYEGLDVLEDYRCLQYNRLMEEEYLQGIY